ncbi:uncharacterized protein LOC111708475 isoform X2 [Eurytemora carolleeae]|uniref:uncharacterized protein LOC111708475 isoform X2 n=1 Tax=Eurytemora carolleeae TaxID=1294199 RepID=UPI000C792CD0|nr:uncharacterized protein LOC111708475 isoform X2 [Eurytemora carolleeae]|eukprot:XP_023337630.1 uncharacterized protein LOC111708475 isoform X2 [Eurytemora affinis]
MGEEESSEIRRYLERTVEFTPNLEINLLNLPSLSFNQWSRNKNSMHKEEFSKYAFSKIFESGREDIEKLRNILVNNDYEEAGTKITEYLKARVENPASNKEKIKVQSLQSTLLSTGVNSDQEVLTENERKKLNFPVVEKLTNVGQITVNRTGSRRDEEKLNSLLKQLGFQVNINLISSNNIYIIVCLGVCLSDCLIVCIQ